MRSSRKRVPLQPRGRTEQAGPVSEGNETSEDQAKPQVNNLPSRKGAVQSSGDKHEKKSKSASLALSLTFLAAPVGRCPQELSVEEVCSLFTWSATEVCVRAHVAGLWTALQPLLCTWLSIKPYVVSGRLSARQVLVIHGLRVYSSWSRYCQRRFFCVQVRLANILDSWGAPDDDGSLAKSTRKIVRAQGVPSSTLGPQPAWLCVAGAATDTRLLSANQPKTQAGGSQVAAGVQANGKLKLEERDVGRAARRRSMRRQSTINLDCTIHEDMEILKCALTFVFLSMRVVIQSLSDGYSRAAAKCALSCSATINPTRHLFSIMHTDIKHCGYLIVCIYPLGLCPLIIDRSSLLAWVCGTREIATVTAPLQL